MKNTKKILIIAFSALLLVCISVGATFAYLTSTPDPVTNTFSVGSVEIVLDETMVDEYGDIVADADPVKENEYKLVPGHEYTKDPTIHVTAGSEPVWLFVKVENGIEAIEAGGDTDTIAEQLAANGWTELDGVENVYWHDVVDARQAAQDVPVFGTFTISNTADVSTYGDASVIVTAYAVQKDSFASAAAAWTGAGFN